MFQEIHIGEKPKFDAHVYSPYAAASKQDQLIAEAWDGRNMPDADAQHDSHHTTNEYHAIYKNQDGEYHIYSFTNIGYVPAIPVTAEKLERAHAAEPGAIHVEHCGWSGEEKPIDKAIEWWTKIIHHLASRSAPQPV